MNSLLMSLLLLHPLQNKFSQHILLQLLKFLISYLCLIWPLSVQPSNLRFGEHIGERKDDDSPLPDFTPIPGVEKDWEVVMLLDTREVRTLQDRSFLHNQLHKWV